MALPLRLPLLATWKRSLMFKSLELQQKGGLSPVVLPVLMVVMTEVLMMLRRDEKRCDFGMCLLCHVIYSYFVDFVNFGCHA
jgi:hypothetical protein